MKASHIFGFAVTGTIILSGVAVGLGVPTAASVMLPFEQAATQTVAGLGVGAIGAYKLNNSYSFTNVFFALGLASGGLAAGIMGIPAAFSDYVPTMAETIQDFTA